LCASLLQITFRSSFALFWLELNSFIGLFDMKSLYDKGHLISSALVPVRQVSL
jgi:hypothetical protein